MRFFQIFKIGKDTKISRDNWDRAMWGEMFKEWGRLRFFSCNGSFTTSCIDVGIYQNF